MENYKEIEGYEDYLIYDDGRVFSKYKGRFLKPGTSTSGYLYVNLCKNGKCKTCQVHTLIAVAFLNHKQCGFKVVVNHIDNNKLNNHISNLELVSTRHNTSCHKTDAGVCWKKVNQKWLSSILFLRKRYHLGYYHDKSYALNIYCIALKIVESNLFNTEEKIFLLKRIKTKYKK